MLRLGQVVIGSRSEIEVMAHERDEWKARAEALAAQVAAMKVAQLKESRPKPSYELRYMWPSLTRR